MSFQANSENMLRYSQHDGLLTEQDQKIMTDFLDTIATEGPPNHMMDITHHGQTSISFHDPQTSMQLSRGFQTGFGSNFDPNSGYAGAGGYIYQPIGSASITIPANNGYSQTANFHQTASHVHDNYVQQQQQYPLNHQIPALNNGLIHGGKVKSIANNHSSALYIKSEPMTVNNRRQRSPSPHRSNSVGKPAIKRTPSRRKSLKNSNDANASLNESKSDEGNNSTISTLIPTVSSSGLNAGSSSTTEATPASPKLASTSESNNSQPLSPAQNRGGRGKKGHHELLTEAEKKANHIASEQKRRQNIRLGFDQLVEIVPTLSQCHRSEALILQKSVEYIQQLLMQKNELKGRVKTLQATLGDAPDHMDDSSSDGELDLIF
ncbi:6476_t:CDS:2 [Funneliformis caledonium]|uniref:6476_t:CDS:1 n=2 Tax=Funneliformis TaxID=1117308 RepID=A0A9N9A6W1_9GLOM|nr:14000_t:CDS:2 [Funneliformis mosseae]CAG8518664.1 6476_t:CDS:2 [Funneliformis caledonium]